VLRDREGEIAGAALVDAPGGERSTRVHRDMGLRLDERTMMSRATGPSARCGDPAQPVCSV
jgi:hypothetical protein